MDQRDQIMFRLGIGNVSQAAAQLEQTVAIVTWGLAGLDQTVARIALPDTVDRMLDVIKQLLPLRVSDLQLRERVSSWAHDVRIAYRERNVIVHSTWLPTDDGSHWRVTLKPLKGVVETRTVEQLGSAERALLAVAQGDRLTFIKELADTVPGPWSVGSEPPF